MQAEVHSKLNQYINLEKESANITKSDFTSKEHNKVVKDSNKSIAEIAAAEDCMWFYIGDLNLKATEDQLTNLLAKNFEVFSVTKLSQTWSK